MFSGSSGKRTRGVLAIGAISLGVLLFVAGVSRAVNLQLLGADTADRGRESAATKEPFAASVALPNFTVLAKKIGPAVVNVSNTKLHNLGQGVPLPNEDDDLNSQFWRRFFGQAPPEGPQKQVGIGSGFIIDRDGTIVTNYHVVEGATKLTVTLSDGRSFDAKTLGEDEMTDIAVLKITAPPDLIAAPLGNSNQLEVGEWVIAVGNPFGLDRTVTAGIVSAKGRHIGAGPYEDFIQTDASVNPGNSGGPLVNMRGEVVGMNTAIFSESGGNIGIGFAIPVNLIKELLPQLRTKGVVVRGYIGATVQRITPEIAEALGLKTPRGVLVSQVINGGPAERAGIKTGDVILAFNDKDINDSPDLPFEVARLSPGTSLAVRILRNGKELTISLTVGELKETKVTAEAEEDLGLTVQPVTPEVAAALGLDRAEGVVVVSVAPSSAADDAGFERGDVISEINRVPVPTMADYDRVMGKIKKGESVLFLVQRDEANLYLAMKR